VDSHSVEDLRARIAELEAENRDLRGREQGVPPGGPGGVQEEPPARHRRGASAVAVVLIVLGCLLTPVAVVAGWGKLTLTDTNRFVATYAPLARDPQVQSYVVDQTMTAFNQNVNVDQVVADLINGVKSLGTGPRADAALDALKGPAANGLESLVRNGVTRFVQSDAFAAVWQRALRVSHNQLTATMQNDPNAVVAAQSNGTIGIQLGPIIAQIKTALIDRGISIAAKIPTVNKTIPIAQADNIGTYQAGYRGVVALGTWLPWVALLFLVVGVLIARRTRMLIGAGLGFALAMVLLLLGLQVGKTVLLTSLPPNLVPGSVSGLVYDTATQSMQNTATAGLVLGLLVAVVAWYAGPFTVSRRLRGFYSGAVGDLRRWAEGRGVSTGRVGEWLYAQRLLTRIIVGVGFAVAIILLRPLTVGTIIAAAAIALGVVVLLTLVERPPTGVRAPIAHGAGRGPSRPLPTAP
jgi:hypothetical protein